MNFAGVCNHFPKGMVTPALDFAKNIVLTELAYMEDEKERSMVKFMQANRQNPFEAGFSPVERVGLAKNRCVLSLEYNLNSK